MLTLKHLAIKSFNETIAYIHKDCSFYTSGDVRTLTKIEIHGGPKPAYALLQVVEDDAIVSKDELGVNSECFDFLGLAEGSIVSISVAPYPNSFTSIKRKTYGNVLSSSEYNAIIEDIISKRYSNMDIAAFLVAMGSFMTHPEVLSLTQAMIGDKRITWDTEDIVVDHYSIGGVPGNKTDIIITAIVAAYGMAIPKICSHSLTSCSGVANVCSVLMNIDLDEDKLKNTIKNTRGAIFLYESLDLGKINGSISCIEKYIGLTRTQHLAASIIALKIAMGITHLLVDIPVGPETKIRSTTDAMRLRKMIEYVGDSLDIHIDVVISDGQEPIGNGVGPILEARDIMKILRNKDDAPQDLREKSLFMAGKILEFDPKLRGGHGLAVATEILQSGRALEAFNKIIYAQGKAAQPEIGFLYSDIFAPCSGEVVAIDNATINYIGILAGASRHHGSGLDLFKKIGDFVEEGEKIFRIYSSNQNDFNNAVSFAQGKSGYQIK